MTDTENNNKKRLARLGRYRLYFIAGHSRWFVFLMGLSNFSLLFFNFIWIGITSVPEIFRTEMFFLPVFFISYIPFATIFGYWDLTRGTFKGEASVSKEVNPIISEQFERLERIEENQRKIIKFLQKDGNEV